LDKYESVLNIWIGFTVSNSKKGVVLDGANHNLLENIDVNHIEDEAVHFRKDSSDNTLKSSTISHTGLKQPGYGEGLYFGSAVSNWVDGKPDKSNRNKAINNHFGPNIAAEAIDIKEGTEGGLIDGNTFDGTGMSGENSADSWIDVKGDDYTISNNKGSKTLLDGFQVKLKKIRQVLMYWLIVCIVRSIKSKTQIWADVIINSLIIPALDSQIMAFVLMFLPLKIALILFISQFKWILL